MSEVVGEAIVRIKQDDSGYDPDGAGKKAGTSYSKGFGSGIKGLAGTIAGVLAVGKGIDFLKDSTAEARESQKVSAQTAATLKATGNAAGVTADQVGKMAGRLSSVTGVDDEVIQQGSNLLLTFKNVKNYVDGEFVGTFDRANAAALDLSAAGFGSVSSASVMLGKALNDPIKGITALGRSGVTFSESQKAQIKALAEAGKLSQAQSMILKEVEGQVGGVAAATATSGEKASVAFGNIKESIGTLLLPAIDAVENAFVEKMAPAIQGGITALSNAGPVFDRIGQVVASVVGPAVDTISAAFRQFLPVLQTAGSTLMTSLMPAIQGIVPAFQNFVPVLQTAGNTFTTVLLPTIQSFAQYVVANVLPVIGRIAEVFIKDVVPAIAQVATFVYGTLYPALVRIVTTVASNLKPVLDTLIDVFVTRILPTFQSLVAQIRTQLLPALEPIIVKVLAVTRVFLGIATAILGKVLPPLLRLAGFIISKVVPVVVTIITVALRFVGVLLSLGGAVAKGIGALGNFAGFLGGKVKDAVQGVVSAVTSLPGKIIAVGGKMLGAGKTLMGKLFDGIVSAAKGAGGLVTQIATAIKDGAFGIINFIIDKLNGAIPNELSIPGPNINLPDNPIPHLQGGTPYARAGYYDVGEVGPERVYLPEGARVLTAAQTRQENARQGTAGGLTAAQIMALRPIEVHNHYPLPEKPSTATQRLANLPFLLGA